SRAPRTRRSPPRRCWRGWRRAPSACASPHGAPGSLPLLELTTLQGKFNSFANSRQRVMSVEERLPEPSNPLGIDGIEFVEYATAQPQAFGALLQKMGFAPVARHRSREVVLYRQGSMNMIVNSHKVADAEQILSAIALRVRDAAFAHQHS